MTLPKEGVLLDTPHNVLPSPPTSVANVAKYDRASDDFDHNILIPTLVNTICIYCILP
jgi:hypothetical protein